MARALASMEANSQSTTVRLRDSHVAVMDWDNIRLIAIQAHLMTTGPEKDSQDNVQLGPGKTVDL